MSKSSAFYFLVSSLQNLTTSGPCTLLCPRRGDGGLNYQCGSCRRWGADPQAWWPWSWVASTCSSLERGLGSQQETGLGHGGESTRYEPLDQKRIPTRAESSKTKYLLGRKRVRVDRHTCRLRRIESRWIVLSWQFELLLWGISSGFPLTNHFGLPGSPSLFAVSQDPPRCAHTSLSQNGFYRKGIWVGNIPWANSPLASKESFLCMCGQGGLLTLRIRNKWSGQGPVSSLNCSPILILEFHPTGNESLMPLRRGGGGGRHGARVSGPQPQLVSTALQAP